MTKPLSPAFSFYPKDFVSSPKVAAMTTQEVGAYVLLLCAAWVGDPQGHLPDDDELLRRIARMTADEWRASKALLMSCFEPDGHGRLYNKRLLRERMRQETHSAAQRENGKRGAASRWRGHSQKMARPSVGDGEPMAKHDLPSPSPSSCEHASACSLVARALSDDGETMAPPLSEPKAPSFPAADAFEFLTAWNALGAPFAHVQSLGPRVSALAACYGDAFFRDNWVAALKRMSASAFCRGSGTRGWVADIGWFLKPGTVYELMEGKHDDRKSNGAAAPQESEW